MSALASCYRAERHLPDFLASCAGQTIVDQVEVLLVHNDPTRAELEIVERFSQSHPGLVRHVVTPREPFTCSINRAISLAQGEYLCIWNVDDLRTDDSLERMAQTLDSNQDVGFTYGDFAVVNERPSSRGEYVETPSFDRREFVRSMIVGPFFMWRSELQSSIGAWDEQFMVGSDFDFAIRLALEVDGAKTDGLIGSYLNEGTGLSTSEDGVQAAECAAIVLRYGIYDKLDLTRLRAARRYRRDAILRLGEWIPLIELVPERMRYASSKYSLATAALRTLKSGAWLRLIVRSS